ncbi:YdiU family protein [Belliella kenyensis]|uniref:Protein nucleotidyltransferase YdiU n=1 Tax=Belliella kenyensis TaxID=1472724 RepID=A0ABV8EIT3_9BACT|nr:YdiU family protein [Belliella kenyensis]MCH7400315.1 YdiU family protein [Belliella kenyensis]MDN3604667.1 YdiU family protein [Belliella kenyensis]
MESLKLLNDYTKLPAKFFSQQMPNPVLNPKFIIFNNSLAEAMGLPMMTQDEWLELLSGNQVLKGSMPISQAYAGHQFGNFTMLGDGRAVLLGEFLTSSQELFDIQLKGSGRTPYSRGGDGRATVSAMLREYLISEAMHNLGIPTTRSLAVVNSGEKVQREMEYNGGILTRIAKSHLRVGTFEYAYQYGTMEDQKALTSYAISRHYPELENAKNQALELLKKISEVQADLIVDWMRVGFIHGVMNTDNMSIAGETIDYGPCAFMNSYDPNTVFSSIDTQGRYAYRNQPRIAQWNLSRLAIALLDQLHTDQNLAIEMAQDIINSFPSQYESKWLNMMRNKLGWEGNQSGDQNLIEDLLHMMHKYKADYTNTFLGIADRENYDSPLLDSMEFQEWSMLWMSRATMDGRDLDQTILKMKGYNPVFIPRNHMVETALMRASQSSEFGQFDELLKVIRDPYQNKEQYTAYRIPPENGDLGYQTFCGT